MKAKIQIIALSLIITAASASAASPLYAQDTGSTAASASQASPTTKAQKKAARKEARAKKNAELKKLQDAGYNPGRGGNDPNYPQDLQDAQKKAGMGGGTNK